MNNDLGLIVLARGAVEDISWMNDKLYHLKKAVLAALDEMERQMGKEAK